MNTNGVRVTPFSSSHLDRLRKTFQKKYPQRFDAYSFLIEAGGLRIGHSADLGRPADLEPLLKLPLDLLVCELAHFRAETPCSRSSLRGRDVKRIVFVHLGRCHWDNLREVRRLAAKMLPGISIAFARDRQMFSF